MTAWHTGQRAVIDRRTITTIDRVTPAGRVVTADGRTFNADGRERANGDPYRRPKLEPLTEEIEAEMALVIRARAASTAAVSAVEAADEWLRHSFIAWRNRRPDVVDVARAEELAAAIRRVLEDVG